MNKQQEILKRFTSICDYATLAKKQNELGQGVYVAIVKDLCIEIEELLGVDKD